VKKLRLAGSADYDDANRYLAEHSIAEHNRRYARPAAETADYHRRRPTARQLDPGFWLEEERVVSEDWVVRYKNRLLQLERQSRHWAPARNRVRVRENQAGQIQIHYRQQCLPFREVPHASTARSEGRGAAPSPAPPSPSPKSRVPSADHPWRKNRYQQMKTPAFSSAWRNRSQGTFLLWTNRGHFYCGMTTLTSTPNMGRLPEHSLIDSRAYPPVGKDFHPR
jgi:hypothetical protein